MTLSVLDVFNLSASIASIILSLLAIGLSLAFFLASKKAERNSEQAMTRIDEATSTLSRLSLRMLSQLTTAITTPKATDEKISDIIREVRATGLKDAGDENATSSTKADLDQFRIDNLIAAMFYAALCNIALQDDLPPTIGVTESSESSAVISTWVDQSKKDYLILKSWVRGSDQSKVSSSPVKHLYDYAFDAEINIKTVREFYAQKENTSQI